MPRHEEVQAEADAGQCNEEADKCGDVLPDRLEARSLAQAGPDWPPCRTGCRTGARWCQAQAADGTDSTAYVSPRPSHCAVQRDDISLHPTAGVEDDVSVQGRKVSLDRPVYRNVSRKHREVSVEDLPSTNGEVANVHLAVLDPYSDVAKIVAVALTQFSDTLENAPVAREAIEIDHEPLGSA